MLLYKALRRRGPGAAEAGGARAVVDVVVDRGIEEPVRSTPTRVEAVEALLVACCQRPALFLTALC